MSAWGKEVVIRDVTDLNHCITLFKDTITPERRHVLVTIWEAFLTNKFSTLREYSREIERVFPPEIRLYAVALTNIDTNNKILLRAITDTYKEITRLGY